MRDSTGTIIYMDHTCRRDSAFKAILEFSVMLYDQPVHFSFSSPVVFNFKVHLLTSHAAVAIVMRHDRTCT